MKIFPVISLGLIFLCTAKCDSETEKKLADSINHFTLNLYKELIKTEKDNVICSGFSLYSVLSMLLVAARGNTSTEINNTLGYDKYGLSEQQIKDSFRDLLIHLRRNDSGYDLEIANSVWLQSGFHVLPDFLSTINNNFFVEEKQLDFGNPSANAQINAWVNEKTKGRIPTLFDDPLDPLTRLVLANAVYFNGTWVDKFNTLLTSDLPFISKEMNILSVPMMSINKAFRYSNNSDLSAQILELPYIGGDASMIFVLPTSIDGLEAMENELTLDSLNEAINLTEEFQQHVQVTIPKFNFSSKIQLNTVLQSLGIVKAFSKTEADLSGINGEKNLYVSDSIQKADIKLNEEGTLAAAVTQNSFVALSGSWGTIFMANHPFLFIIRQKSTGILLFVGRVANF